MRKLGNMVVRWLVVTAICVLPVQGFALTVNTSDIANGAVTTPKIADGAVTAAKLGIVCPSGQYLQYNGSTWVCSVGTAGPQGVAGTQGVQGVKGDTGLTGSQGPAGTMPHYSNVIVVAKSGGDFTDPIAAVNSITDASALNPYLVKIMPGVYDLGSGTLDLKSFVDVEGSGEKITFIKGAPPQNVYLSYSVLVTGTEYSEVRNVTIHNYGGSTIDTAIALKTVPNFKIRNSTLHAVGGNYHSLAAISYGGTFEYVRLEAPEGLENFGSTVLDKVVFMVGFARNNAGGVMTLNNVFMAPNLVLALWDGGSVTIRNSLLGNINVENSTLNISSSEVSGGIYIYSAGNMKIAHTKVGAISNYAGTLTCVGVYNNDFTPVNCSP